MANFLGPWFVQIASHSAFAPHIQTIPTLPWTPGVGYGEFDTWAAGTKAADDMIEEFVDLQAPFFPTSYAWDYFTIYSQPTIADPAIPVIGKVLTQVGTAGAGGEIKATQATWSFKTTTGGLFKLVQLDLKAAAGFTKTTPTTLTVDAQNLVDAVQDQANGWSGRDGARPSFFLQIAYTLNEKLRRQYHMN
jgi:hypothetical protein